MGTGPAWERAVCNLAALMGMPEISSGSSFVQGTAGARPWAAKVKCDPCSAGRSVLG
jgi:hypothetical protein